MRRGISSPLTVAFILLTATGCGPLVQSLSKQNEILVAAEPLTIPPYDGSLNDLQKKKEILGQIVYDSEQKCTSFLNRLVLAKNTVDTTGDIVSAALSGVGALVTPLSAAHALSGAATFVTGAKTAIDTDIYAKAALSSFSTALQVGYSKSMKTYIDNLPALDSNLIMSNEVAKITAIHATCSLAQAEAAIQDKITSTGSDGNKPPSQPPAAPSPRRAAPPPPAAVIPPQAGPLMTEPPIWGQTLR